MKCLMCESTAVQSGLCQSCYINAGHETVAVAEKLVATIAAQHDTIQRKDKRIAELEALFGADQRRSIDALTNRIAELEFDNVTYKEIIADWQIKLPTEQNDGALYSEGCGL